MAESEARWYVVHTYSGYENKVATDLMTTAENRNLQDMIIDVKVPVEIVTETVGDKTKEVENKLMRKFTEWVLKHEALSLTIMSAIQFAL